MKVLAIMETGAKITFDSLQQFLLAKELNPKLELLEKEYKTTIPELANIPVEIIKPDIKKLVKKIEVKDDVIDDSIEKPDVTVAECRKNITVYSKKELELLAGDERISIKKLAEKELKERFNK